MAKRAAPGAKAPLAAPGAAHEAIQRQRIEGFRRLAAERNNPLYVWEAIVHCSAYGYPVPDWCMNYIEATAIQIHDLIVAASTWEYSEKQDQDFKPSMTATAAAGAIPRALQILQKTRNAFDLMATDRKFLEDARTIQGAEMAEIALGATQAVAQAEKKVRARRSVDTIRAARARVRKGRTLRKIIDGT